MLLDTLKTLCALSGPSSYEGPVREYIAGRASAAGAEVREDRMGCLIVTKKGAKPAPRHLMLCTHMDEVGLIVKRITEEGYIKFGTLGEIDRRVLIGKQVWIGKDRHPGVIGMKAVHLTAAEERGKIPQLDSLYIDIGARNMKEASRLTHLGDYAVFSDDVQEFGHGMLKAKALNRIGCAVMLELLDQALPMDCTFAFTVQQEVGTRGAFGVGFSVQPELALILDASNAADDPGTIRHRQVCVPGNGPVIPYMDETAISDSQLFNLLRAVADENQIPWQTKGCIAEGTDAGTIQGSRSGVRVASISAAVRYLRSPTGVASIKDFEYILKLAGLMIGAVADGRV